MEKFENLQNNVDKSESPEKILSQETGITSRILTKIKNSSRLLRAFKILAISVGLLAGTESFAQEKHNDRPVESDKTEQVDQKYKNLREVEHNRSLLQEKEYTVPSKVLGIYARIVDPESPWGVAEPVGGYFQHNYLDKKGLSLFTKNLKNEGYTPKQVSEFIEQLSGGSVVFNENALTNKDFKNILGHERMHKEIHRLSEEQQKVLNEARDFIINDYKVKEKQWNAQEDSIYQKIFGDKKDMSKEEEKKLDQQWYNESKSIIEQYHPILKNKYGSNVGGLDLATVITRPNEFYTYLLMGKIHSSTEESLKDKFPEAYKIFDNLRNNILNDIENKA